MQLRPTDRIYCAQPLSHIDGRAALMSAVVAGASVVLGPRLQPAHVLDRSETRRRDAVLLCGQHALAAPQATAAAFRRRATRVDRGWIVDAPRDPSRLRTTVRCPAHRDPRHDGERAGPRRPQRLTVPRARWASRPQGLRCASSTTTMKTRPLTKPVRSSLRPLHPNTCASGYWNHPEATVRAWRNLWFHTGDLGRVGRRGLVDVRGSHEGRHSSAEGEDAVRLGGRAGVSSP